MKKIINRLKNMVRNINYLSKHVLWDENFNLQYNISEISRQMYLYEIYNEPIDKPMLNILDSSQSLDLLLKTKKSFCRFNDGEIDIMQGKSIPFQKYSPELAEEMLCILDTKQEDILIGINYHYFHSIEGLNSYNKRYYRLNSFRFREFLLEKCNLENTYIDGSFNQLYQMYEQFDYDSYYEKMRRLFTGLDLVIFAGGGVLEKLEYNLFESAKSVEYVSGPSKDAYFFIDEIIIQAQKYEKSKVLCFILGPASKVLVYRLYKLGYRAWDLGHMPKDYDSYMRKEVRVEENIKKFYAPD